MAEVFDGFYRGSRILITGAYGFKGTWLSYWLRRMGADVCEYGHAPRWKDFASSHYKLLYPEGKWADKDTLNYANLRNTLCAYQPDLVFHFAAKSLVIEGINNPRETFENNLMGAVNVMDACRDSKVRGLVLVTTDKVYGDQNWIWGYRENDILSGNDPYSASKIAIEHAVRCYQTNYFPMIAVARAGNVIGGGDWSDNRLIPDVVKAASKNEAVIVNTPGATRPWQHVLEPLSGYLMLGKKLYEGKKEFADVWNFGPQGEMTVMQVLEAAKAKWNTIRWNIQEVERHKGMVNLLKIDSTKAHKELGWSCQWSQQAAVEITIEWYRDYLCDKSVNTNEDIEHYEWLLKVAASRDGMAAQANKQDKWWD